MSEGTLPSLAALCSDLTNATSINRALSRVFLLMAQGRISQKQAVAFGYITQLLLQTLPGVRSEFVSVYDPNTWRARLRASFEQIEDNDGDDAGSDGNINPNNDLAPGTNVVVPNEHCERGTPTNPISRENPPAAVNRSHLSKSEAPQSSESKQEPDRVAEVITLVPRSSPAQQPPSNAAETAAPAARKRLARDFYGNPIPPADAWCSLPGAAEVTARAQQPFTQPANNTPSPSDSPGPMNTPNPCPSSSSSRAISSLTKSTSCPSNPHSDKHTTHTTAWFSPVSWSSRNKPDPYPTCAGKLRNKFRSMANSAFRRMHHQNSRGFWSPGTKQFVT